MPQHGGCGNGVRIDALVVLSPTSAGTDRARGALQVNVQPRDEERTGHDLIVPHVPTSEPARACATLGDVPVVLTSRRHVDLKRTSSAICSAG